MDSKAKPFEVVCEQTREFVLEYTLDFLSSRVRVERHRGNVGLICQRITELAYEHTLSKAVIKVREWERSEFMAQGFVLEAIYEKYFAGNDALSMSKYFDASRKISHLWIEEDQQLMQVREQPLKSQPFVPIDLYQIRVASPQDCDQLVQLYRQVFEVYPTPIHSPQYIKELMGKGAVFIVAEADGELISTASAHIDTELLHAEIAECVTLPTYRKQGLMRLLIMELHDALRDRGIFVSIANARSQSFGMNSTFHQLGYSYGGRLTNHCIIYKGLEDLNVWTKDLSSADSQSSLHKA